MAIEEERIDRTFGVGASPELSITNVTGSTDVRVWDSQTIRVVASKRPGGTIPFAPVADGYRATEVLMEQSGNTVTVKTRTDYQGVWSFLRWLGGVALVDYVAFVPPDCSVVASQATGSLTAQGLLGSLVARTVSASITVRNLAGSVALNTVSGKVTCDSIRGRLAVKGVSGRVSVERSRLLSFSGKTVAGNMQIQIAPDSGATYDLETVSGDAQVEIPPGVGVSASVDSMGGKIASDLAETPIEVSTGHWRSDVNGGGLRVHMRTVGGVLRLTPPVSHPTPEAPAAAVGVAFAAPVRPAPSAVPPEPEEIVDRETVMKLILRAVEQGSLTVEEAASKLAQLELAAEEAAGAEPAPESRPHPDDREAERGH